MRGIIGKGELILFLSDKAKSINTWKYGKGKKLSGEAVAHIARGSKEGPGKG
jgi:hypothetical protein